MKKIRCIIIDDEPLARKGLKEYIGDVDFLELAGAFDSALRAMDQLGSAGAELIFLDIQMPKLNGLEFFKSLQPAPPVVFTTAFPQYALDGFELNALDYLVKPISFERFLKAALRAREFYDLREVNKGAEKAGEASYFFIKADNKLVKIFLEDVLFVEALQNYVVVHTATRKYLTYLTFKSVEEYLPPDRFIRTHKSYIVAAARIDHIDGNEIRLGEHHIPISRSTREEVMERLLRGRFLRR